MIIIKRKKGDVFVNEKNVSHVIHDEENKQAIVEFRHIKGKPQVFDDVEFVVWWGDKFPQAGQGEDEFLRFLRDIKERE